MELEDLQVYQLSMSLGDRIWDIVVNWDYFAKDTVGKQLVKAEDSVASKVPLTRCSVQLWQQGSYATKNDTP